MKIKTNIPYLIIATLLAVLFASCNTGNKVVSSFGKRKYTKGYYYASTGKAKSVLPIRNTNTIVSSISSSPVQTVKVFTTDEIIPVVTSPPSAIPTQQKRTILFPTITAAENSKATVNFVSSIFHKHDAADANLDTPSAWDIIATLALIFSLLAIPLIFEGFLLSKVLTVAYTTARLGFFLLDAGYISTLLAIILGFIGFKSDKRHGVAVAALYIATGVLIASLLFSILFALSPII